MLKTKAILVNGSTFYKNGAQVRDLDKKVEQALDSVMKNLNPEDIVDVKINSQFQGVSGDQAFILVLYKESETKKEVREVRSKEVESKNSK